MAEVKFLGKLREITGVVEEVGLPHVRQVLDRLVEEHGLELAEILFPKGDSSQLGKDIDILVNGRSIGFLNGLDTGLGPGDKITILYHGIRGFPGG